MTMRKKLIIIILAALVLISAAVFIYRYQILQYTAETLIRKYLPDYIKIDTIKFDFGKGDVALGGFKFLNPPGFTKKYLLEISSITCHYQMRSKNLLDGIELSGPVLNRARLYIERLSDGRLNLGEVNAMIAKPAVASPEGGEGSVETQRVKAQTPKENMQGGGVKLPETFLLRDAAIILTDRLPASNPNVITFENINTEVALKMDASYTNILSVASSGEGCVNGDRGQVVRWVVSLTPTTPRLTMANRFEVYNVLIKPFEPYYDRYSPLVFVSGRFSGLLIFDFDNGMIGSSDELRLSGLKFYVKPGYENAAFLETTVQDLVKYFTTPYGEVVFDFKIKGDMTSPQFYLGPRSKEALVSMAVDKISAALQRNAAGSSSGEPKTDIEKAKDYINMFKGLIKQ